jgi:hypothetical protein
MPMPNADAFNAPPNPWSGQHGSPLPQLRDISSPIQRTKCVGCWKTILARRCFVLSECNRSRSFLDVVARLVWFAACRADKLARTDRPDRITRKSLHPLQSAVYHLATQFYNLTRRAVFDKDRNSSLHWRRTAGGCAQLKKDYDRMVCFDFDFRMRL